MLIFVKKMQNAYKKFVFVNILYSRKESHVFLYALFSFHIFFLLHISILLIEGFRKCDVINELYQLIQLE